MSAMAARVSVMVVRRLSILFFSELEEEEEAKKHGGYGGEPCGRHKWEAACKGISAGEIAKQEEAKTKQEACEHHKAKAVAAAKVEREGHGKEEHGKQQGGGGEEGVVVHGVLGGVEASVGEGGDEVAQL